MNNYPNSPSENYLKGRIAETIIEELFIRLGYNVYRFGLENAVPQLLMNWDRQFKSEAGKQISLMPDFVVQKGNNSPEFIEVKFRASGTYSIKSLPKGFTYNSTSFIIVSKSDIQTLTYEELLEGKMITKNSDYQFDQSKYIQKGDQAIYKEFLDYIQKYLNR